MKKFRMLRKIFTTVIALLLLVSLSGVNVSAIKAKVENCR